MGICYNERKKESKKIKGGSSINQSTLDNPPGNSKDSDINSK